MLSVAQSEKAHPQGEVDLGIQAPVPAWPVDTPGGRYYAEMDCDAPVTREGQLVFFAQFLQTGGRWQRLLEGCPLRYVGNRASGLTNVVGTAALSILCGHWRYAHISAVRGDRLNPPLLGMSHVVSEDVVRGDCAYGQEDFLRECEAQGLPGLFKLRHSAKVKRLLAEVQRSGAQWQPAGDGWEVIEASLRLSGWSRSRRVVLVREKPAIAPVGAQARRRRDTLQANLPGSDRWVCQPTPWAGRIAVLVSTLDPSAYPAVALARLYRERADAENIYDELKNQWGWGGYTTRSLAPSRLMANLVALLYNWWHLYARLYDDQHHREAITSRPALLHGVGRLIRSGGQRTIKVSVQHENSDWLSAAILRVSNSLQRINSIAQQWDIAQRWALLLTYIFRRWLGGKWLGTLPPGAHLVLSG